MTDRQFAFQTALHTVAIDVRAVVGGRPAPELGAIVKIADCSGVLVRSDVVLTNGHCLEGRIDSVSIAGKSLRVASCAVHPHYDPADTAHDLGFCRLEGPADASPIPIADQAVLDVGTDVMLAGRGRSGPLSRDGGVVRVVETQLRRASPDHLEVGTTDRTACLGDSGGAVLIRKGGALRVAGILRGGTGAICGSPAEAVPLAPHASWLGAAEVFEPHAPKAGPSRYAGAVLAGAGLAVCVALLARSAHRLRSRVRSSSDRDP